MALVMAVADMADITVATDIEVDGATTGLVPFWAQPLWEVPFTLQVRPATLCLNKCCCNRNICRLAVWRISAQLHNSFTPTFRAAKCLGNLPTTKTTKPG